MNKIKISINLLLLIFTILLFGCNNVKFNSDLWKKKGVDWEINNPREKMLDDLLSKDSLKNKSKEDIITLLGVPEIEKKDTFVYLIIEKHNFELDPDYIKYLNIYFNKNVAENSEIIIQK